MRYTTRRQYLQTGVTVAGVLGAGCLNNESSRVYEDSSWIAEARSAAQ